MSFAFLSLLPSSIKQLEVFVFNPTNFVMVFAPNSSLVNPFTFLFFPFGNDLTNSRFEESSLVSILSTNSLQNRLFSCMQ